MTWAEVMCSWCGERPAIGEDHWREAPTCGECALLVTVRPFGWAAAQRARGPHIRKPEEP